jgi:tetrahydromethanopterin S-methyltransferase subunit F
VLTEQEIERLRKAIVATVATPVIGSIEDYTWEAIFHYVKDISLSDPALGRNKLLYDGYSKL